MDKEAGADWGLTQSEWGVSVRSAGALRRLDDQWEIVPFGWARQTDWFLDLIDRGTVEEFLRGFKSEYAPISRMREVLSDIDPVIRRNNDALIRVVAAKLVTRQLVLRTHWRLRETSAEGGGGGDPKPSKKGDKKKDKPEPPPPPPPPKKDKKKSWFSITAVHKMDGPEKVVLGLAVNCSIPDLGDITGKLAEGTQFAKWDDLLPGGTADVLGMFHDDEVWEVVEEIT